MPGHLGPDLRSLEYFLWEYLKDIIYAGILQKLENSVTVALNI